MKKYPEIPVFLFLFAAVFAATWTAGNMAYNAGHNLLVVERVVKMTFITATTVAIAIGTALMIVIKSR